MRNQADRPVVLVADPAEIDRDSRVIGTGGWRPPEQREALDWLTLLRLSGWGVAMAPHTGGLAVPPSATTGALRWIVIACAPESLQSDAVEQLGSLLQVMPVVVICRTPSSGTALAALAGVSAGADEPAHRTIRWQGPGAAKAWQLRGGLRARPLTMQADVVPWAQGDAGAVVVARRVGKGWIATLGFHPSQARDEDGALTAVLRHLLVNGACAPVAWLDHAHTVVLRIDDPGGSQNVFCRNWSYPRLTRPAWLAIGDDLQRRQARLTVGYVSGWLDDGDARRGRLTMAGQEVRRTPGAVYPSPDVVYEDLRGHRPGSVSDCGAEHRALCELQARNIVGAELHGYTHMYPDGAQWAQAPDRYDATSWFRELGPRAAAVIARRPAGEHPLTLGFAALRKHFGQPPTTLICPGDEWTNEALERALDLNLHFVASYYLALRDDDRFCWSTHVCAPYLNEADARWFDSGLPVVGYFHDYEPAREGPAWVARHLDEWQSAGAQRMIDFRELAGAVARTYRVDRDGVDLVLHVDGAAAPPLVRDLTVHLRTPDAAVPERVRVCVDGETSSLSVERSEASDAMVVVPATGGRAQGPAR